jgi:hypothetical protein
MRLTPATIVFGFGIPKSFPFLGSLILTSTSLRFSLLASDDYLTVCQGARELSPTRAFQGRVYLAPMRQGSAFERLAGRNRNLLPAQQGTEAGESTYTSQRVRDILVFLVAVR